MKYDNDYIRKEADDKLKGSLRNLFLKNSMKLKEHSASAGEDNGTDFYFDVTNEKEELSKCLKENYIEGVAKIYIEELV